MDYIVDRITTMMSLSVMGLAITDDCTAEQHSECLACPKERQCAFLSATINALEKGEEV